MPIYSEILNDESILQILRDGYHQILIVGCGACMNESLAYKHNLPLYIDNSNMPYATIHELHRIKELLTKNGYQVEIKYYNNIDGFFCMTDIAADEYPLDWEQHPDIILMLSCNSGCEGLRDRLPDTKIVKITKLVGGVPYGHRVVAGKRIIVAEESTIIPLIKKQEG